MKDAGNKKRKHGAVQRLFAALGVLAIFITSILTLIFGLSGIFVAVYVAALASITGPAFTEEQRKGYQRIIAKLESRAEL